MTIQIDLIRQTEAARALIHACRDDLDGDEQATADMVEGSTDLVEALTAAALRSDELDMYAEAIGERIKDLQARKARFEQQSENIRDKMQSALGIIGLKKLETPFATISVRATARWPEVTDIWELPVVFREPQPPKVNLRALKLALKEGDVPGATLKPAGTTLAISTR